MKTWNDYKNYVKENNSDAAQDIMEMENLASIISVIINQRNLLGLTQCQLADLCGLPQSSIAGIESVKTTPKLDTLLRIMKPLGLRLNIATAKSS